jgi:hypothetical protein
VVLTFQQSFKAMLGHMLYHITSLGFVRQSFDAMVDGIVEVRTSEVI